MGIISDIINGFLEAIYQESVVNPVREQFYEIQKDIQEKQETVNYAPSFVITTTFQRTRKPKRKPIYDKKKVTLYVKRFQRDYSRNVYHRRLASKRVMTHMVK